MFLKIINKQKLIYIALLLVYLVLAIVIVPMIVPLKEEFQFNLDEGLVLMRALLYGEGYAPHVEIWSDQPFLFPALLSFWLTISGKSILSARLLTIIFSALLIWFFFEIIRLNLGIFPAFIGSLSLAASSGFIRFSSAIMIGIPSLSLAVISIYFLFIYKKLKKKYLLAISSVCFALSLQIKFFTILLIPIILIFIIIYKPEQVKKKDILANGLLWLIICVIVFIFLAFLFNELSYEQLILTHFGDKIKTELSSESGFSLLSRMIRKKDFDLFYLSILGVFVVFVKRRWEGLFPVAWLGTAFLLIINHHPVWPHHYCLIAIPMAWLAAYGSVPCVNFFKQRKYLLKPKQIKINNYILGIISLGLIIFALINLEPKVSKDIPSLQQDYSEQFALVDRLSENKNSTQWLFTDVPIYGFYADLVVPPEIAVFSMKRLKTKQITQAQVYELLVKYQPEQILIGRFKGFFYTSSDIYSYLNQFYVKSEDISVADHYVLKSLK
ncbi:glycosyltransferase family 39 protein [Crocosphaera chwakensis]|uniref:Glucose-6-phosphate 1-dehydrogenase n=1 Tax=Crocosphaera chwakensis CCY0110 TaxID=391612 RepID=A3IU57_9CHRO|nr:glycosyltransferase family 39 protein [Crocosphaera chwakensis]EAZ90031.1 glucose-6-phosphate 1-dehydrogenase [Crocosphaera chwakensis CCY0110]